MQAFQQPLIATVDPEYLCRTDALGPLSPEGAPETAEYDRKVWAFFDALRKDRRPEPEDLPWGPEPEPPVADVMAMQQETEMLRVAIRALPEAQRELIEQAYFGDLSHREIAARTGLPLGTIKSRIRLALDRLRHAMK